MNLLIGPPAKMAGKCPEVRFEVGNGIGIRIGVVYTQTTTNIDDFDLDVLLLQLRLDIVDAIA